MAGLCEGGNEPPGSLKASMSFGVVCRIDPKSLHTEYAFSFKILNITSRYNISGRVLLLPITGDGIAKINLSKATQCTVVAKKPNRLLQLIQKNPVLCIVSNCGNFNMDSEARDDVSAVYSFDVLKKLNPHIKKEVGLPANTTFTFDVKGMKIHLDNLFNGDKFLGENMNHFLNENWQELLKEMGPAVGEALNQFITAMLNNIFELVPIEESLPDL
ncbi:hypothetical protein ANN_20899 [Periplaneta americana]|uniref:Per a allergen n=1 Tax=Periplaneta americana TaxID=6978 RepID=A0ABQ8SDW4_PERAM|nr:hypothetical protein ANN_20899 [Periplaneta americana]